MSVRLFSSPSKSLANPAYNDLIKVMVPFQKLSYESLTDITPFLPEKGQRFCDLTPGNIFMWRNEYPSEYAIVDKTLLIKKDYAPNESAFLFPLGDNIEAALETAEAYCLATQKKLAFYALSKEQAELLSARYPHHQVLQDPAWSDYLYNLSDLRDFPGKRYESKRHNANRFKRMHPTALFKIGTKEDEPRLETFLDTYVAENEGRDISLEEIALTKEMIHHFCCIKAQMGYYELDGKIIGFGMGERQGDTIYQHIEKALREYDGIYQALTSEYLKTFGGDALYVNREEDDGNEGLRSAKEQLHPLELLEKRFFEVLNPIDLLKAPSLFSSERLLFVPMEETDKARYFDLVSDPEINRYWGYDFHQDLKPGEEVNPDFFYRDILAGYREKSCWTYMVKSKTDERLLGALEIYDFQNDGSAEIGLRLFKEAQGQGYGKESLHALIAYAFNNLGFHELRVESFPENAPSIAMIEAVGFQKTSETSERIHFSLKK
jgi:RimJ/RimL family protein N-acetyltransferase